MKTPLGWTALLITLSTLTGAETGQAAPAQADLATRLERLGTVLRSKAQQLPTDTGGAGELLAGWANGGGGRGFANARRGGWGDGSGGRGFVNVNPWRNGWADGGGFVNRGGGGFVNW
ncbi:MAG: rSAM-associated Gly-rich repeat protein [Cyanobacteria bacterium RI_101]|nr:rSAM-associated Gly-rich repeat protein [Cyanobacteria bacterium RI_101]